jgi:hypothetical protein
LPRRTSPPAQKARPVAQVRSGLEHLMRGFNLERVTPGDVFVRIYQLRCRREVIMRRSCTYRHSQKVSC